MYIGQMYQNDRIYHIFYRWHILYICQRALVLLPIVSSMSDLIGCSSSSSYLLIIGTRQATSTERQRAFFETESTATLRSMGKKSKQLTSSPRLAELANFFNPSRWPNQIWTPAPASRELQLTKAIERILCVTLAPSCSKYTETWVGSDSTHSHSQLVFIPLQEEWNFTVSSNLRKARSVHDFVVYTPTATAPKTRTSRNLSYGSRRLHPWQNVCSLTGWDLLSVTFLVDRVYAVSSSCTWLYDFCLRQKSRPNSSRRWCRICEEVQKWWHRRSPARRWWLCWSSLNYCTALRLWRTQWLGRMRKTLRSSINGPALRPFKSLISFVSF